MADQQRQPAHGLHPDEPEPATQNGESGMAGAESRRGLFIVASRLLAYPDRAAWEALPEIEAYLCNLPDSGPAAKLAEVTQQLRAMDACELEARYVATFDFNASTALYLTAHELGDSRGRGQALVELRAMLRAAGFEEVTQVLPDYLPVLLEFLGHVPADAPVDALERRLAAVCEQIATNLKADNLYRNVFVALRAVFPEPGEPQQERRFSQREEADTGEMPYPLRYD